MNTNDLLQRWSALSLDEIEAEIQSGKDAETVDRLIGADTAAELRQISFEPPPGALEEVILLPGIMGSNLSSIRGVTTLLWINPLVFLQGKGSYLRLNAEGNDDESTEVECLPVGLEKLTYLKIGIRLNKQTHLHEFPYDWRRPMEYNADLLHARIERWAAGDPHREFTLVAHSMGGLVARTYMARHPGDAEKRVKRLILHGTPNFGAANAVDNLVNGNSMMETVDKLNSQNEMRLLANSLPSVYQLLPAPPESFPSGRPYPVDFDLYDAAAWPVPSIRQKYLDAARFMYAVLWKIHPQIPVDVIAGFNVETLVSLKLASGQAGLVMNSIGEGEDSGDGTVPLWSSLLPSASCYYIQEVHRKLPANNRVIAATLDLIRTGECDLPEQPEPAPSLKAEQVALVSSEVRAGNLQLKIETGTAGENDLANLYFAL